MKIHLYFINWNDSFYLSFLKRHYGYCERMTMFDNHSTDGSVQLARSLGMNVKTFGNPGELDDAAYLEVKNNCWKEVRHIADYVIICDADEFLYHPDMLRKLIKLKKMRVTIPRTQGYEMVSEELPREDMLEVKTGFKNSKYSKSLIFDPKEIDEINFNFGSHNHQAIGRVKYSWSRLKVLHYRNIGGIGRLIERHQAYEKRLSDFNRERKYGIEYGLDVAKKKMQWRQMIIKSRKIKIDELIDRNNQS